MNGSDRPRSLGTVLLPFGDTYAASVDMLLTDRCRALGAVRSLSPFSAIGPVSDNLAALARSEHRSSRAGLDARKDLARFFDDSGADYLVVDNTSALRLLREYNGVLYTVVPDESSDVMDALWHGVPELQRSSLNPVSQGLSPRLREHYYRFVNLCKSRFPSDRIILVQSHVALFFVDETGRVGVTDADPRAPKWLAELDRIFADRTGCHVVSDAMSRFPQTPEWDLVAPDTKLAIEAAIADIVNGERRTDPGLSVTPESNAVARVIAEGIRQNMRLDLSLLLSGLESESVTYDDVIGLQLLAQEGYAEADLGTLVRAVLSHRRSQPLIDTRNRLERGIKALSHAGVKVVAKRAWKPTIHVLFGNGDALTLSGRTISRRQGVRARDLMEARDVVTEHAGITPGEIWALLESWQFHISRAREGNTSPPLIVGGESELYEACAVYDWQAILREETLRFEIGPKTGLRALTRRCRGHVSVAVSDESAREGTKVHPKARIDVGPLLDPSARVLTCTGGLMDQVQAIAEFERVCASGGLNLVVNDCLYQTAWSPGFHDGFVAASIWNQGTSVRLSSMLSLRLRAVLQRVTLQQEGGILALQGARALAALGVPDVHLLSLNAGLGRVLASDVELGLPRAVAEDRPGQEALLLSYGRGLQFWIYPARVYAFNIADRPWIQGAFDLQHLEPLLSPVNAEAATMFAAETTIAVHVRRGDYLGHADWHAETAHYREALEFVCAREDLRERGPVSVAVFSDDPSFVREHAEDYGFTAVGGRVTFVDWNRYFESIFDAFLISQCEVVIASVGGFAATSALLAQRENRLIKALPDGPRIAW